MADGRFSFPTAIYTCVLHSRRNGLLTDLRARRRRVRRRLPRWMRRSNVRSGWSRPLCSLVPMPVQSGRDSDLREGRCQGRRVHLVEAGGGWQSRTALELAAVDMHSRIHFGSSEARGTGRRRQKLEHAVRHRARTGLSGRRHKATLVAGRPNKAWATRRRKHHAAKGRP